MIAFAFAMIASFSLIGLASALYCLKRAPLGNENEFGFQAVPETRSRQLDISLPNNVIGISRQIAGKY